MHVVRGVASQRTSLRAADLWHNTVGHVFFLFLLFKSCDEGRVFHCDAADSVNRFFNTAGFMFSDRKIQKKMNIKWFPSCHFAYQSRAAAAGRVHCNESGFLK